jgi:hypothetical protein
VSRARGIELTTFFRLGHMIESSGRVRHSFQAIERHRMIFIRRAEGLRTHVCMTYYVPGLPDGLFSNKKSQFGQIL